MKRIQTADNFNPKTRFQEKLKDTNKVGTEIKEALKVELGKLSHPNEKIIDKVGIKIRQSPAQETDYTTVFKQVEEELRKKQKKIRVSFMITKIQLLTNSANYKGEKSRS